MGDFDISVSPKYFKMGVGSALLVTGLNSLFRRGVKRAVADFMVMNGRPTISISVLGSNSNLLVITSQYKLDKKKSGVTRIDSTPILK